jgi:hypothetical protein
VITRIIIIIIIINLLVLSAMGVIPDILDQGLINLYLPPRTMFLAQKEVVLSTCSVTTKFLSDADRLSDDEADNP